MKPGRMQRQEKVEKIKAHLSSAQALVISDYRGLTVEQITELRRELAKHSTEFHVHKNRFMKIAFKDKNYPQALIDQMTGPNAVAYVQGDINPVLKTIYDFTKQRYPVKVRGSYIGNAFFDASQSSALSKLPSREAMLSIFIGTVQAPIQKFANCLNEVMARFVRTMAAVADKKKE